MALLAGTVGKSRSLVTATWEVGCGSPSPRTSDGCWKPTACWALRFGLSSIEQTLVTAGATAVTAAGGIGCVACFA